MKNKNNRSTKEYLGSAIRAGGDRLLHNPSKGEQALFICTVVLSFAALILSAVTAIMSKDAMTIVRAFTENIVMFALVVALTVSDRVLVFRGRSLILLVYALIALVRDGFGFVGASGIMVVLTVLGVLSGLALYGTLIVDQFNGSDSPVKYWLVYGGALYKLIYLLVSVIVNGNRAAAVGVVDVLSIVASGLASAAVILMLVYQFDGFSFIKYFFYEITSDVDDEDEAVAERAEQIIDERPGDTAEPEYVPYVEQQETEPVTADKEQLEEQETVESEPASDEVLDDFGYVPYDDGTETDALDSSVKPLTSASDKNDQAETEAYEAYEKTLIDEDVLIDESVAEPAEDSNVEAIEDIDVESGEMVVAEAQPSAQQLYESLTPVERKYVKFAMQYHKPADTLQVEGLAGDLFDVWVDGDIICFQNDLDQASEGRGVRTAAIPFDDVQSIGIASYGEGGECIVLAYSRGDETIEIGFTKDSFKNFKRVMMACAE
ncbi:MAG: hypothetical protein IJY27_06225 [Clostridia bacterium]|nr:hypothetical protein [Clostridia bacterium]